MTDMTPPPFEAGLLPSSATPYMRAVEAACRLPEEVWRRAGKVGDILIDAPDEALPFLIWEHGLEEVLPYVSDLRRVLDVGKVWQRIRGTPSSIALALSWIDAPLTAIEEDPDGRWWDLFQLALSRPALGDELAAIVALARLSKPAHTDLIRIYNPVYDLRAQTVNRGKVNGPGLVNDWSGVWLRPDWPKISYGRRADSVTDVAAEGSLASELVIEQAVLSHWPRGFRVNCHRTNGRETISPFFARCGVETETTAVTGMGVNGCWPDGPWSDGPWGGDVVGYLSDTPGSELSAIGDVAPGSLSATESEVTGDPLLVLYAPWTDGPWSDGPWLGQEFSRSAITEEPAP